MKLNRYIKAALLTLVGVALAGSTTRTQAQITNTYLDTFDIGANTANFAGSGSVASWIYWYNTPGGNLAITNDITMDASNNPASGSLRIDSPFLNTPGTQNLFFGTFGNGGGYDFSTTANLLLYSNISFDIHVDPSMTPFTSSTATNFGSIGVGVVTSGYGFDSVGSLTIPLNATNGWVHMSVPIDKTAGYAANPVPGIGLDFANYSGYPEFNFRFWIDNISLVGSTAPPPGPPSLIGHLQTPVPGLNSIGTSKSQYQRYHLATINDTGYTFVGQPSVTYSWTISAFPTNSDWQQHIFLVNGQPGQYDQAADYNLADCIFMTVQSQGPGQNATFNFRYKTNEPAGNSMLFNALSPTNAANTNLWPVMPVCSLQDSNGPIGTWSITFAQTTNVTLKSPSGFTTNFTFDADSAALFADPMSICVGGQVNSSGFGQILVTSNFTVTGSATPLSDNFATDTVLDTNTWKNQANDTNGVEIVPPGSAYWLNWTLPDASYSLQASASIPATNHISLASIGTILNDGQRQVLLASSNLPSAKQGFFSLVKRNFSQLQVLLPGETAAPGTVTGKTGTPTPVSLSASGGVEVITVNAVDANWFPVPGVIDSVSLDSTDSGAVLPNNAAMVNGTVQFPLFLFQDTGTWTVTATDVTDGTKTPNTSSQVVVTN